MNEILYADNFGELDISYDDIKFGEFERKVFEMIFGEYGDESTTKVMVSGLK